MKNFLDKIAYISRIKLPKNEKNLIEIQINEIINYAEIIINYSNSSKKKSFNNKNFNVFRPDITKESISEKNEIIKNSPKSFENFFIVPNLIKRK